MPLTQIELGSIWPKEKKIELIEFVHATMVDTLRIPEHDRFIRIIEHSAENFFPPTNASNNYILILIHMFPGRSLDTKRVLYKKLCSGMKTFGIDITDTRVVISEIPAENWGIRGGQAGSDVVLGFETHV